MAMCQSPAHSAARTCHVNILGLLLIMHDHHYKNDLISPTGKAAGLVPMLRVYDATARSVIPPGHVYLKA